jgi:hypothetical protein
MHGAHGMACAIIGVTITRCSSLLQDQNSTSKESIGMLVWAPFLPEHPKLQWPGEAIDPLCPPKGRQVPPDAFKGLSKEDQDAFKHALQQSARERAAYGANATLDEIEQQQLQAAIAASTAAAAGDCSGASQAAVPPNTEIASTDAKGRRGKGAVAARRMQPVRAATPTKVLVNLFCTHKLLWMDRSQLLDFGAHRKCAPASLPPSPCPCISFTHASSENCMGGSTHMQQCADTACLRMMQGTAPHDSDGARSHVDCQSTRLNSCVTSVSLYVVAHACLHACMPVVACG